MKNVIQDGRPQFLLILLENQAQQAPGTHREAPGGPKRRRKALQETPGMPPRRGQDASQEAPGRARDASKRLQEAPGHDQDASIGSKSRPDLLRSPILGDFRLIFYRLLIFFLG